MKNDTNPQFCFLYNPQGSYLLFGGSSSLVHRYVSSPLFYEHWPCHIQMILSMPWLSFFQLSIYSSMTIPTFQLVPTVEYLCRHQLSFVEHCLSMLRCLLLSYSLLGKPPFRAAKARFFVRVTSFEYAHHFFGTSPSFLSLNPQAGEQWDGVLFCAIRHWSLCFLSHGTSSCS